MECFGHAIFHDRGRSAEIRDGLEGGLEVDLLESWERKNNSPIKPDWIIDVGELHAQSRRFLERRLLSM